MGNNNRRLIGRKVNIPIIFDSSNGTFSEITIVFTSSPGFLSADDIKFYISEYFDVEEHLK